MKLKLGTTLLAVALVAVCMIAEAETNKTETVESLKAERDKLATENTNLTKRVKQLNQFTADTEAKEKERQDKDAAEKKAKARVEKLPDSERYNIAARLNYIDTANLTPVEAWAEVNQLARDAEKKQAGEAKSEAIKKAEKEAKAYIDTLVASNRMDVVQIQSAIRATNEIAKSSANDVEQAKANATSQVYTERLLKHIKAGREVESAITKVRVGYVSFSPYAISKNGDDYELKSAGDSGSAFVEIAMADRYAWRTDLTDKDTGPNFGFGFGSMETRREWDWEARVGFLTGNNSSGTNTTSGAAVAAAGDLYAEIGVGYPIFYGIQKNGMRVSWNVPELVGTWVTEKDSFDIYDSYKLSTSIVASGPVGEEGRNWKMLARVGYGWIETPSIDHASTNSFTTVSDDNGQPKYGTERGFVSQVLFDVPILEHSTVTLSGEFWNVDGMKPWSAYISYSKTFSELQEFLKF